MNISGIGFHMSAGTMRHYDNLNQGFGHYDYSNQYRPAKADAMDDVSDKDFSLNVNKAVAEMKQDSQLQEFQVFVRSGETPEPQRYQEDWMRPVENFAL